VSTLHHHLIANVFHFIAGGALSLAAAGLAHHFGTRSADRLPGDSRWPHCAWCLRPLRWQDIFPLFGWLLRPDTLSLPCPCGLRKGLWAQPAAELAGLIFGLAAVALNGWTSALWPLCFGLGLLPAMALIDLQFGVIPDGLNILTALFGLWWVLASGGDVYMAFIITAGLLAVGLFCALAYSRWRGREMLGLGDVKFFAAAGLWLQPQVAPWFLALAGVIGIGIGLIWRRMDGSKEFPFAPALCLSLAGCILYELAQMP
jgi:leader peptidase (prepilin peptidase)/N-methyltransferase